MKALSKIVIPCILSCFLGCSTLEGPTTISLGMSDVLAKVNINSDFVMIKKGDTLQLQFTAISVNNSPLQINPDSVHWLSQDTSQLTVDQFGRIVGAVANSLPIRVVLSYKHNLNTASDSVLVYITNDKYEDATIQLVQIDSNIVGAQPSFMGVSFPRVRIDVYKDGARMIKGAEIPVAAPAPIQMQFNANGGPDGEAVYFVTNERGYLGRFWVKSSLNLYGSIASDSLLFIGQYPVGNGALFRFVSADENGIIIPYSLNPLELEPQLQPCGIFTVFNFTSTPFDVVFSDSAESVSGCDSVPSSLFGLHAFGGNLLSVPAFGRGNRRTSRIGIITWYLRDPVTKEKLPYSGRYESISIF